MFVIPAHRLPPGFAERLDQPPVEPAPARPAATAVLLRDSVSGPEVLLLQRHRSSGFVPGAYVFPGGRVDEADADPAILERADGLAARREPEPAYWVAAVREVFEETGVLLAKDARGRPAPDAASDPRIAEWRAALLAEAATMVELLDALELRLDFGDVVYAAHWITPVAEPRRYDTRFFLARLPEGREARPDPREMTEGIWLRPADALERFRAGRLPMVFPTVSTLESLIEFGAVDEALASFRGRPVPPILPRLVRTAEGVGIVVDGEGAP
jgi:8-oxo-dGTP pyrophosphatase MutT (NUDIX family)